MSQSNHNGPYTGPQGPVFLSERQRIAAEIVGVVEWSHEGSWGYCACPGASFHTGKTAKRDCRVFAGLKGEAQESPNVYCLHTSCAAATEAASTRLRSAIGKAKVAAGRALPPTPSGRSKEVRPVRHTARTGNFGMAEESRGSPAKPEAQTPTARTAGSRPLTRFAHVRAQAHVLPEPAKNTSVPYVAAVEVQQPIEQPQPKAAQPAAPIRPAEPGEKPGIVTLIEADGSVHRLAAAGKIKFTFPKKS